MSIKATQTTRSYLDIEIVVSYMTINRYIDIVSNRQNFLHVYIFIGLFIIFFMFA